MFRLLDEFETPTSEFLSLSKRYLKLCVGCCSRIVHTTMVGRAGVCEGSKTVEGCHWHGQSYPNTLCFILSEPHMFTHINVSEQFSTTDRGLWDTI